MALSALGRWIRHGLPFPWLGASHFFSGSNLQWKQRWRLSSLVSYFYPAVMHPFLGVECIGPYAAPLQLLDSRYHQFTIACIHPDYLQIPKSCYSLPICPSSRSANHNITKTNFMMGALATNAGSFYISIYKQKNKRASVTFHAVAGFVWVHTSGI